MGVDLWLGFDGGEVCAEEVLGEDFLSRVECAHPFMEALNAHHRRLHQHQAIAHGQHETEGRHEEGGGRRREEGEVEGERGSGRRRDEVGEERKSEAFESGLAAAVGVEGDH